MNQIFYDNRSNLEFDSSINHLKRAIKLHLIFLDYTLVNPIPPSPTHKHAPLTILYAIQLTVTIFLRIIVIM